MYIKTEPTGCRERKGMVQVRLAMYLEFGDARYEEHYVQLPVIPLGGYQGKIGEDGTPISIDDYNAWVESLPKVWQNNPFHNHFIYAEPDISDEDIMKEAEKFCKEAYKIWEKGGKVILKNEKIKWPGVVDALRKDACNAKVQHLKETVLECKLTTKATKTKDGSD